MAQKMSGSLHMVTSLVMALFFIVVGLPLWWKTTATYRANLPHADIQNLAHKKLLCRIPVSLISCQKKSSLEQIQLDGQLFEDLLNGDASLVPSFSVEYSVSARHCSEEELSRVQSSDFKEKDSIVDMLNGSPSTELQVYLLPNSLWGLSESLYVGKHTTIFGVVGKADNDLQKQFQVIASNLKSVIFNEQSLANAYVTSRGVRLDKVDPDTVRALQSTPSYEVSFSLMNADPAEVTARWNIQQSVEDFLQPFLDKLSLFADFSVSSQVLYYIDLPLRPKKAKDKSHFFLSATSLPLLINPVESKIGSHVSMNPTLNFLIFVPPLKYSPLYLHDMKGNVLNETNAFYSPRWGGYQIQNAPNADENVTLPIDYDVDMKSAMEVFLSQLRVLIGVPNQKSSKDMYLAEPDQVAITDWEIGTLLRKRTIENIATSTNTLYSLSTLLEKINNMVINDDIAAEVYIAVECLHNAHQFLADGDLHKAFVFSKKAIVSSEKAFFDPSLLELLYFPEDQKFAIYIPLFLPAGIPIIASLFKAIKWMKMRRKEKQS